MISGAGGVVGIKTKAPPQILPKPAGKTTQVSATATMATGSAVAASAATTTTAVPVQAIAHAQPSQALLLNQVSSDSFRPPYRSYSGFNRLSQTFLFSVLSLVIPC